MREGWEYKKLGEVAKISSGKAIPSSDIIDTFSEGLYPCYGGNGLRGYVDHFSNDGLVPVIGRVGALCGNVHLPQGKFYATEHALVVYLKTKDKPHYIEYLLSSLNLRQYAKGVAQPVLSASTLSEITIPVPPLSEQQRIVSELDLLSSIIEKKKAQLKEYDQLAQSIFFDMFGDPVSNEKGWEVKKLGEVCAQKTKIARASKSFTSNSPIEYIDISSIDNNSKTITTTTSYIFCDAPSRAQQIVEYGDILISLVRPNLQNIAIVLYNKDNLVGSSGFCVIRPKQQTIKEYLFYVIRSSYFTDYLMQRVSGANYPAVREEDVKSYTLPIPPLSLQQSFASKIEAIERQKALIQQSITEVETLFNSRMDYYFN